MSAAQDYVRYLMGKGLSQVAATAAVARFTEESSLRPSIMGDKSIPGGSVGFGQWNRERKQGLMDFAGDKWSDPYRQLDYFIHEGQGPEARAYNALLAAKTPEEGVNAMMAYERPYGWSGMRPGSGLGYANTLKHYSDINAGGGGGSVQQPEVHAQANFNPSLGPQGAQDAAGNVARQTAFDPSLGPQGAQDAAGRSNPRIDPGTQTPSGTSTGPLPAYPAATGGAAVAAAPTGAKKGWRDLLASSMAGFGKGMESGMGQVAQRPSFAVQASPSVALPTTSIVDPNSVDSQRQAMAQALARLNAGKLYG